MFKECRIPEYLCIKLNIKALKLTQMHLFTNIVKKMKKMQTKIVYLNFVMKVWIEFYYWLAMFWSTMKKNTKAMNS